MYATSRRRTRESAEILSAILGLPVNVEPALSGPDHGEADGQPWDEIKAAFGGPPQSDPDRRYAVGSETWNQYLARARTALANVIQRHHGQRILIAGHGETTDAAAMLFLGLAPGFSTRVGFETNHAALTRWNMQRNRLGQELWVLAAHNDTQHLATVFARGRYPAPRPVHDNRRPQPDRCASRHRIRRGIHSQAARHQVQA
jgi:probable phosphoglycerate mutase